MKLPHAGVEEIVHQSLKPEHVTAIAARLREPYSTLILFLAVTGPRIGEAIGIKWADFDGDLLNVSRTIYEGKAQSPKTKNSVRTLPIPAALMTRLRALDGKEYVFRSRENTPINPGNALKRYVHTGGHPSWHKRLLRVGSLVGLGSSLRRYSNWWPTFDILPRGK